MVVVWVREIDGVGRVVLVVVIGPHACHTYVPLVYNSRIEFGVHDAFEAPAGVGLLSAATIPSGVDLKVPRLALPV